MDIKESQELYKNILENMSEGVIVVGFDNKVNYISSSASKILGLPKSGFMHTSIAQAFYSDDRNDDFNQLLLDAIYESGEKHSGMVEYYLGEQIKHLYVTTDYIKDDVIKKNALIVVISDMSEIYSLENQNEKINSMFERYLSKEVAQALLESPDGLEMGGKKREITIMMTDLRGFTAISDSMPPNHVISMLNSYLAEMVAILKKYNGTVLEFIGDAILATFGAPREIENPEAAAVACAIEMQNRMSAVNKANREKGYPMLEMGIGINSGIVVMGNIGSEDCTKFSVIGGHVNLASRIESFTVGGQVLVSEYTRSKITQTLDIRDEIKIVPKGVKTPVLAYDICGIGAPFEVSCTDEDSAIFAEPDIAMTFNIYLVKAKHIADEQLIGSLFRISEKRAILSVDKSTAEKLSLYSNCRITGADTRGIIAFTDVFAKVIANDGDYVTLHLTAPNLRYANYVAELKG